MCKRLIIDQKTHRSQPALFCFGLGYSACEVARRLIADGWNVAGTCRTADSAAALKQEGINALAWSGEAPKPELRAALAAVSHVLISVPPAKAKMADGDPVLAACGDALSQCGGLRWLGYLSTTGVYGDHQGGWVDESTPLAAANDRSRRRGAAEDGWRALSQAHDLPLHIFRLAGIYGPGSSIVDRLANGTARQIIQPGQVFSRIHVEDLARVIIASMAKPRSGAIYNVADDEAAAPDEVLRWAAEAIGMEAPPPEPFESAELSDMARSFYGECKRVSNARIKEELGVTLKYPTYRDGLGAIIREIG